MTPLVDSLGSAGLMFLYDERSLPSSNSKGNLRSIGNNRRNEGLIDGVCK
jgi:hypothetical protein